MAFRNKKGGELVALEARVRNWHDRLPPAATRMRQELGQVLAEIETLRGKWAWGRAVNDLADKVTRLEGSRLAAERLFEELGQATGLLEGLVSEVTRLSESLPMPALRQRLTGETTRVTQSYAVRLNDDEIAVSTRTVKEMLRQFTLTRKAVTLLVDGRRELPSADEAAANSLRGLLELVAANLDQQSVTTTQVEDLASAVAACRAAGATRPAPRPSETAGVARHEIELRLRDSSHWVRVLGTAVPDAKARVEELHEAFNRLSRNPSGAAALLAALNAFRDEMVGVAALQRTDRESRLGLDIGLLTNVIGTDLEFERLLEQLKNQPLAHPDEHMAHVEESGRLVRSLDNRVQTSARQLVQYWGDTSTQMRARFEEVQKKPRRGTRSAQVDALRRDFEREATPDGGPTHRPRVVLAHIRQLEELQVKLEKAEIDRRSEEDTFRRNLEAAISGATTWRSLAERAGKDGELEEVLAAFIAVETALNTSSPILDDLQPSLDAADAGRRRIAKAIEAYVDSRAAQIRSSSDLAQELEKWGQKVADVPFESSGGSTVEQLTLAIDELERWQRGIDRALSGASQTYFEQRTQLKARLGDRASAPSLSPEDAVRVRDVAERCPAEDALATGGIEALRATREWLLEAETLLDTLDREATEIKRTVAALRDRVRLFRDRGFHEFHPLHYERLLAVAGGLPSAVVPPAMIVPQLQHLRAMLEALEQDALLRTVEQVANDLAKLKVALERVTEPQLRERGQRLLRDFTNQADTVVPSLAQRNALASLLRGLPE